MGAAATGALVVATAGAGLAHECVNASRNGTAGAQIIMDFNDNVLWVSNGLQHRVDKGLVNMETGEGFSGLVGFDVDGDGVGDVATWIVGPNGEIPLKAQFNGQPCKGVTNIEVWFQECMGG
ncbi:MAG TPA: hypothetical protein VFX00_10575 [Pedococcus sp.]|jgi:hypothetical protein|nr:hypothetical protein [Pedococcus sp.]